MTVLGAGFSAAGTSPAGTGDVPTAPAPATNYLIDSDTGLQENARKIDASTGQYVTDSQGRIEGMPRVRQLVLLRVRTVLGTASVTTLGTARQSGDRNERSASKLEAALRAALSDLVTRKLVSVTSVTAYDETTTRERGLLLWKDLTSGREYRESL